MLQSDESLMSAGFSKLTCVVASGLMPKLTAPAGSDNDTAQPLSESVTVTAGESVAKL